MVTSAFNAKRFAGKPLKQPLYQFDSVASCNRDLEGSTLYEVTNRDDYVDATAEMVLLCNEATRRSKRHAQGGKRTSKPLSLEYIADRLDIDDPMTGYFVRDKDSKLQGFITCTTFTNWQKTFRWDSVHDSAFSYDEEHMAQQMLNGERVYDADGSLAAQLQQTVRCGDPWNEGIVWPQLAEISLLGGLGCGKALLGLVIEQLETMKPTANQNYDYVVLQATENSIPFYESMGFIRVGALTIDDQFLKKRNAASKQDDDTESKESATTAAPIDPSSPVDSENDPSEIVSSPVTVYVVEKPGESPTDISKKFNVSVWDIVFLNHYLYKDLNSRSRLMKGTKIFIPSHAEAKADASVLAKSLKDLEGESSAPRWYISRENDTPKMIARKFGVNCKELVRANIERLPELLPLSRLKDGTRIKVSHFHLHEDVHVPYCHWTFPDDSFENGEPSYMMARKLNRRPGAAAKDRPVQSSFAVPVSKYLRPPATLFHEVTVPPKTPKSASKKKGKQAVTPAVEIPGKPKRPLSSYVIFCSEHRDILQEELAGKPASEHSKVLAARWKELGDEEKAAYLKKHEAAKKEYEKALAKYEINLARFFEKHPDMRPVQNNDEVDQSPEGGSLFNKVVTVKAEALRGSHKEFKYFYVLTFIPDLMWCHLVPMRQVGIWGSDKPKCEGRPIWMLVDESEGKELDISASFCHPVKSRGMKRTADADEEQWDIPSSANAINVAAKVSTDGDRTDDSAMTPARVAAVAKKSSATKSASKSIKRKSESERVHEERAPQPQKKGKSNAKLMKSVHEILGKIRDVPLRKAAPLGVGTLCEGNSALSLKKVPGKAPTGKRKDLASHAEEATSVSSDRESPPPMAGLPEAVSESKGRAAKKDATEKQPPRKAPKKRGLRSPNKSSQLSKCQVAVSLRPRRDATVTPLSCESGQSNKKRQRCEATPQGTSDASDTAIIQEEDLGCELTADDKTIMKKTPEGKDSPTPIAAFSVPNVSSPRPTKRSRINERESSGPTSDKKRLNRPEPALLKGRSPLRRSPSRRATAIFTEKSQLGISSPLLLSRRLIIS